MSKRIEVSDEVYDFLVKEKEYYAKAREKFKYDVDANEEQMLKDGWAKPSFNVALLGLIKEYKITNSILESYEERHTNTCLCDECEEEREERRREQREHELSLETKWVSEWYD